jgi:tetratricopeptide (TPR) repeat protein
LASRIDKELERIERIIFQGRYFEAMEDLKEILKNEEVSEEDKVKAMNLHSLIDFYLGDFDRLEKVLSFTKEAYEKALKINKPSILFRSIVFLRWFYYSDSKYEEAMKVEPPLEDLYEEVCLKEPEEAKKIEPLILIARALNPTLQVMFGYSVPKNYMEDAIELTKKAYELADEREEFFPKLGAINNLSVFYYRTGRIEEYYDTRIKYLEIQKELGNKYGIINGQRVLAGYHLDRGEYEKFLDYIDKNLRISEEMEFELGIVSYSYDMGRYYILQKNYEKALECFEIVNNYYSNKKSLYAEAWSNHNIGYVYKLKGDLHKALEYIEKGHNIISNSKLEGWWEILPSLVEINLLLGNLDVAFQYEQNLLDLFRKMEYTSSIAFSLKRISSIYFQKGLYDEAVEKAKESLNLLEETKNNIWIGNILADLIFILSEKSEIELARKYLSKFEKINLEIKDTFLNQSYNFSEAIILAKRENERDKMKASLLLENLLREKLDYAFQVKVLLSLSEVLIKDLQETGNEDTLFKLQKYVLELYSLASTNKSHILTAETILLQSKLALIELDKEKAESLLEQAFNIASDNGLDRLKESILKEREVFKKESDKLDKLDKESPIQKKIEALDLKSRMNGAKKASLSIKQSGEQIMLKSLF